MTEHKNQDADMREARINALLDGELDDQQAEQLKADATDDQALARAIIEAYQLQRAMEQVRVEPAPASLRRKLKRIPRDSRPTYLQPRWVAAFAAIPLAVLGLVLIQPSAPPAGQIRQAEIEQAQRDLAVAFAYIDQVGNLAGKQIETQLVDEMSDAVAGSIFRTVQHQKIL
jgi:anti-sigma factor RsiW